MRLHLKTDGISMMHVTSRESSSKVSMKLPVTAQNCSMAASVTAADADDIGRN